MHRCTDAQILHSSHRLCPDKRTQVAGVSRGRLAGLDLAVTIARCRRVAERADKVSWSPNGWTRWALAGRFAVGPIHQRSSRVVQSRPVTQIWEAWIVRGSISTVSKGVRDLQPLMSEVQACPLRAPMLACIHQSQPPWASGEPLAKPQDSRQSGFVSPETTIAINSSSTQLYD